MKFFKINRFTKILFSIVSVLTLGFVGLMGYFHTPSGSKSDLARLMMPYLGYNCPLDTLTYETATSFRQIGLDSKKGSEKAATLNVADFDFKNSNLISVQAEIAKLKSECKLTEKGFKTLTCSGFPLSLTDKKIGLSDETVFTFDKNDRLIALSHLSSSKDKNLMIDRFSLRKNQLQKSFGKAHDSFGQGELKDIEFEFDMTSVEYKFSDLYIQIAASNINSKIVLYEQYFLNDFQQAIASTQ